LMKFHQVVFLSQALLKSLSYALELNDYHDFLRVATEFINNECLIKLLHQKSSKLNVSSGLCKKRKKSMAGTE